MNFPVSARLGNVFPMSMRDKVNALEHEMRKFDPIDLPVLHHFSDGVYARELFIPKGTLLTGKIHKFRQLNIMTRGVMDVLVDDQIKRVTAPFVVVSPAGTKRVAYAHEDTVWITIHGTEETDLEKIEQHFIAENDADYSAFLEQAKVKEIAQCHG